MNLNIASSIAAIDTVAIFLPKLLTHIISFKFPSKIILGLFTKPRSSGSLKIIVCAYAAFNLLPGFSLC